MLWGEAGLGAGGGHSCSDCAHGDQGSGLHTLATSGAMTQEGLPGPTVCPVASQPPRAGSLRPLSSRLGSGIAYMQRLLSSSGLGQLAGGPEVSVPVRPPQTSLPPAESQTQGRVSCGQQGCEPPLTVTPTHS